VFSGIKEIGPVTVFVYQSAATDWTGLDWGEKLAMCLLYKKKRKKLKFKQRVNSSNSRGLAETASGGCLSPASSPTRGPVYGCVDPVRGGRWWRGARRPVAPC
jgi:hypothetical protein